MARARKGGSRAPHLPQVPRPRAGTALRGRGQRPAPRMRRPQAPPPPPRFPRVTARAAAASPLVARRRFRAVSRPRAPEAASDWPRARRAANRSEGCCGVGRQNRTAGGRTGVRERRRGGSEMSSRRSVGDPEVGPGALHLAVGSRGDPGCRTAAASSLEGAALGAQDPQAAEGVERFGGVPKGLGGLSGVSVGRRTLWRRNSGLGGMFSCSPPSRASYGWREKGREILPLTL